MEQANWVTALMRAEAFDHAVTELELIETHISWVILTGPFAYKIKKPVDLGFLDFSTVEKRLACAEAEVRLNSRLAPALYLGVVKITGDESAPVIGGPVTGGTVIDGTVIDRTGTAFEPAVKMRQFPQSAQLDRMLDGHALKPEHLDAFAERLAAFHQEAPRADPDESFGTPAAVWEPVAENFQHILDSQVLGDDSSVVDELRHWATALWQSLKPVFVQRKQQGWIRECHGDLHLRNLAWIDEQPVAFDCIEFNRNLSCIDVLCDVAFLVMDLQDRQQSRLANRFLNTYLEHTGDYEQLQLLPYYLTYRALVRAKVTAIRLGQSDLEDARPVRQEFEAYLQLARSYGCAAPPALILTCGLSGSGKTTLTTPLLELLGAIRLRSDIERKRLHGLAALESGRAEVGEGIYGAAAHSQTYQHLLSLSGALLAAGQTVIVDATFLDLEQRELFRELAEAGGCGFVIVECVAATATLRERIENRRGDASDADLTVLQAQLAKLAGDSLVSDAERAFTVSVDTSERVDVEQLADRLRTLIDAQS
jgi:aminoglycoside phosphotransferase family enzyme/predicted kinase